MTKILPNSPELRTWEALNNVLRNADETTCLKLLDEELKDKKRPQFVQRIHSRMNRMRAARERKELGVAK